MKGTIVSIDADGVETVNQVDGSPTLDALKAAIGGGQLQVVPFFNIVEHDGKVVRCVVFCDENGKNTGMPFNEAATAGWYASLCAQGKSPANDNNNAVLDYLVGKIALVYGDDEFMRAL